MSTAGCISDFFGRAAIAGPTIPLNPLQIAAHKSSLVYLLQFY
jgi:hypothetical protein